MNDYITQQLDKVLQLDQEKNQVISRIKTLRTKRKGSHILIITKEEKDKQIEKARKVYDAKINAVYIKMNQELKKAGLQELENPYQN
jgi:NCAIR mutase (PurE)-related protein